MITANLAKMIGADDNSITLYDDAASTARPRPQIERAAGGAVAAMLGGKRR
jgi:hypothetical protein